MQEDQREHLQEKVSHGNYMLPFVQYVTWLPDSFTSFSMHWHKEVEIIYVELGKGEINIDLDWYEMQEGDIIILRPYSLHSIRQAGENNCCFFSWLFDLKMLSYGSTDASFTKYLRPFQDGEMDYPQIINKDQAGYENLKELLLEIHEVWDEKQEVLELNLKWRLEKLFYHLFCDFLKPKKKLALQKQDEVHNIRIVLDYIHENYQKTLSIDELANLLHFSEPYFMRFFKKHTGTTCVDYINDYRISKAAELLSKTDMSIMEVALQVGMHNISYFNRLFKKKLHMTPKEYRRETQKIRDNFQESGIE